MPTEVRVAVVCPDVRLAGGLRTVAESFLAILEAADGFQPFPVSVATSAGDEQSRQLRRPSSWLGGPAVSEVEVGGRRWRHVGAGLSEIEWLRYWGSSRLRDLLRSADLVQIVAGTPAWAYLARGCPKPVCLQVATLSAWERADRPVGTGITGSWRRLMSWGTGLADMRGLRLPDHVLVENRTMAGLLADLKIPSTLIYPGVDVNSFPDDLPAARTGPILAVGRLGDDRKDWPLLIRAYDRIRALGGDTTPELVIAGRGRLDPAATQLIDDLSLSRHVRVLADLPVEELRKLYCDACMLVLTSKEEGLGLVVLEAMAAGLPVVASDLVGTRESVVHGRTGFLVRRDQDRPETAFAARVKHLLDSPEEREKLGVNGRIRAREVFSHEATQTELLALYRRLVKP